MAVKSAKGWISVAQIAEVNGLPTGSINRHLKYLKKDKVVDAIEVLPFYIYRWSKDAENEVKKRLEYLIAILLSPSAE
ncbi:MAG: hypothetical protein KME46_33520 [Brasilonema angustatum HA4187-MV1]|nr:hypothetical protein [Brasilonema angustatum HA4187-MV1]